MRPGRTDPCPAPGSRSRPRAQSTPYRRSAVTDTVLAVIRRRRLAALVLIVGLVAAAPAAGATGRGAGREVDHAVVGGVPAEPGEYPFLAALVWLGRADARAGLRCGAVVVGAEWVLTAAHCTDGFTAGDFDVVIGRTRLSDDDGERVGIAEIRPHPGFDRRSLENDIALLRLDTPATAGEPIRWVTNGQQRLFAPGTLAIAMGWGLTRDDPPGTGHGPQDGLRWVEVPIRSTAECEAAYGSAFSAATMICAGHREGGRDSCRGDSGGPLLVVTPEGIAHVGIVSWGEGCAEPGLYGVYARTATYAWWIVAETGIGPCRGIHPTIVGTRHPDVLRGTPDDDVILGRGGDDIIYGGGGDDIICGGRGNDTIYGGGGDDRLFGQGGDDVIFGGPGDDLLRGGAGDDRLVGGPGWDRLFGGGGTDTCRSGELLRRCEPGG